MPGRALPDTQALYEDAACGLLLTDGQGTIHRANNTFCRWFGSDSTALVGRRFQDLLTMGSRIFHQTHWSPLLQMQGSLSEVKLELATPAGKSLPILVNARRYEDATGPWLELAVVVAEDRQKFERELIRARRQAEELLESERRIKEDLARTQQQLKWAHDAAQDRVLLAEQMVGIVSHDLRNPLAVVQLTAALLGRSELSSQQAGLVRRIDTAARRASRMIADLLDFTQARIGHGIHVTKRRVDVHHMVQACVAELQAAFPGRVRHASEGQGLCDADPDRISQLIGNLVANAITYGDAGRPVTVTSTASATRFSVAVHNEGPPIPAELLGCMFDAMTRGRERVPQDGGIGLGLFIVREIAHAHQGEVEVTSSEADGTTFTAEFPAD